MTKNKQHFWLGHPACIWPTGSTILTETVLDYDMGDHMHIGWDAAEQWFYMSFGVQE